MIKRWKAVDCDWCKTTAPMEKLADRDGSWWCLPDGWNHLDNKIHLCPLCSKAIRKAKLEIESGKNEK